MAKYIRHTLEQYIEELSKKSIVPGGGSASAFAASLGAALNLMVINYSIKRRGKEACEKTLLGEKKIQEKILKNLALLVDEDCKVFSALMKALSSKKGDVQKRLKDAAKTPFKVCLLSCDSATTSVKLSKIGARALLTDVGSALYMLSAAFYSARLNVEINLKYIKDRVFVRNIKRELVRLQKGIERKAERIESNLKGER